MDESLAELFDRLAVVGKAFSSARRLALIELLTQGERTVEALASEAGMGVSTVSAHLQVLKLSHLVRTRREGTRIHYRLADEDVVRLYTAMRAVAQEHSPDVERALASYLGINGVDAPDVDEVSREELVERMRTGEVQVVDVRPTAEYDAGHLPGALHVPFDELTDHLDALDPRVEVVAYCRGAWCVMAHDAVRLLRAEGRTARRLEAGMTEWRLAGLPVEEGVA